MKTSAFLLLTWLALGFSVICPAGEPTTRPALQVISASETERLVRLAELPEDKKVDVIVLGTVSTAHPSSSGKVFRIFFNEADEKGSNSFYAVYFPQIYGDMERKFGGKDGAGLAGKRIRITGRPEMYHGRPQIVISSPGQITIGN